MNKMIEATTKTNSINALIRVVNTLNRKDYKVVDIALKDLDKELSNIIITINESDRNNAEGAKKHLEKIIDIDKVMIL